MGNYTVQDKWKTKNKMGECHLEGHFTDPRNKGVEEMTHKRDRIMETSSEGGPGPRRGCSAIDGRI
jgi:hypothetical protein